MLYAGTYTVTQDRDFESANESLELFTRWTPPEGLVFKAHVARADGRGGLFIAEATSHAAILEATTVFAVYFDYEIWPVVEMEEAVPIIARAQAWADEQLAELDDEYDDDEDDEDEEDDR